MTNVHRSMVLAILALLASQPTAAGTVVFSTDFESGVPAEFSAPGANVEPVQGFGGLGHEGNEFAGSFLRYSAQSIEPTTLTLTDLPEHSTLSLGFLLAVIDSWDGTELLEVSVDGVTLFSHWFQIATGDASSYTPPPGALLSSGSDLGFSSGGFYSRDRAYDLSLEPAFKSIPHTASSATIVWTISAATGGASGWQGLDDESWAIDNVRVELDQTTVATDARSWSALKALY